MHRFVLFSIVLKNLDLQGLLYHIVMRKSRSFFIVGHQTDIMDIKLFQLQGDQFSDFCLRACENIGVNVRRR